MIAFRKVYSIQLRKFQRLLPTGMGTTLEEVIANNRRNAEVLTSLSDELQVMKKEIISRKKKELRTENGILRRQVDEAIAQLIALETRSGKKQITIPNARTFCTEVQTPKEKEHHVAKKPENTEDANKTQPSQKVKKVKPEKPNKTPTDVVSTELEVNVGRLDLRVGKIVEVQRHPDADSLYLEKIDCGEAQPRTVVSGLVKFVPLEEMQNRMVVVLCNLKPAKMRGITSEAMVMCASTPEKVEVLSPPAGSIPGDLVHCEGYERQPDAQLNPKKKVFETCAPDLMTNDQFVACYKGTALHVPGKGNVTAQTLKNVNVK